MKEKNAQIMGKEAEEQARAYLNANGVKILDCNWRYKKYEIDIIGIDGDFLVIYEVKARSTDAFGEPELSVTRKKQSFLVATAAKYIEEKELDLEVRFDILALLAINNNYTVKHLKSAFYPLIK